MANFHIKRSGSKEHDCDVAIFQDMSPKRYSATLRHSGVLHPRHLRHRGIALIWVAIFLLLIILLVGLALDSAKLFLVAHQLQNAADAAALAGAQFVKFDQLKAREQAIMIASQNYADGLPVSLRDNLGNDPNLDVVVGRWVNKTFTPTTISTNAVKVVARRVEGLEDVNAPPVPLNFGPIAGVNTVNVTRDAIAISVGSLGAGIIALEAYPDWSHPSGLWIHGTGLLDVQGGDIQVNAVADAGQGHWQALRMNGSLQINAGEFNVVGATSPPYDPDDDSAWEGFYADPLEPFSVYTDRPRIEDPLFELNPPTIPAGIATNPSTGYVYNDTITEQTIGTQGQTPADQPDLKVLELYPGYYPGGIDLRTGSWTSDEIIGYQPNPDPNAAPIPIYKTYGVELRLNHGSSVESSLYALGGGTSGTSGLVIKGNASLFGEYVTIYVTGAHNGVDVEYGVLDIGGNGYIEVDPPGDFFLVGGEPQINGQPGISMWQDINNTNAARIIGTGDFNLSGTLYFPNNHIEVGGTSFQAGNQLIAGSIDLHGTGTIGIAYDGRNWILAYQSYLVW